MMLGSVDPLSTSGINSVSLPVSSSTTTGQNQSFSSVLGNTVSSTNQSSQTAQAAAQAEIFANQLATQQAYNAANPAGSAASATSYANNALLLGLDYQGSMAMMQHNMAGLTVAESLIGQQMNSMGISSGSLGSLSATTNGDSSGETTPAYTYSLPAAATTDTIGTKATTSSTTAATTASTTAATTASNASTTSSSATTTASNASALSSAVASSVASNASLTSSAAAVALASNAALPGSTVSQSSSDVTTDTT